MSVSVIDRRSVRAVAPEDAPAEPVRRANSGIRRLVREQIGRRGVLLTRVATLDLTLRELESEANRAADAHSQATGPLQAELSKLEAAAVKAVQDRKAADPKNEARRIAIIREIADHTTELERLTKAVRERRGKVQAERTRIAMEASSLPDEYRLAQEGIASPEARAAIFCNERRVAAAVARVEAANEELRRIPADLPADHRRRRDWQAEARAASDELQAARREADELVRRAIEED